MGRGRRRRSCRSNSVTRSRKVDELVREFQPKVVPEVVYVKSNGPETAIGYVAKVEKRLAMVEGREFRSDDIFGSVPDEVSDDDNEYVGLTPEQRFTRKFKKKSLRESRWLSAKYKELKLRCSAIDGGDCILKDDVDDDDDDEREKVLKAWDKNFRKWGLQWIQAMRIPTIVKIEMLRMKLSRQSWNPPPDNRLKINVSGKCAAAGIACAAVARDSEGICQGCGTEYFQHIQASDPLVADAAAFLLGVLLAKRLKEKVIIEGHNTLVVGILRANSEYITESISATITDIRAQLMDFKAVEFCYVNKEANEVADCLSNFSEMNQVTRWWSFESPPTCVLDAIASENLKEKNRDGEFNKIIDDVVFGVGIGDGGDSDGDDERESFLKTYTKRLQKKQNEGRGSWC